MRYLFVFGSLEDEHYETLLYWLMIGTMAVGVYSFLSQLFSQPVCQYFGETAMNDLRVSCLRSLLHRPLSYFDRQSTSPSACSVLLSQQPQMAMPIVNNQLAIVMDGMFGCVSMLVLTFVLCGPSGFIGFVYLVSFLALLFLFSKISDRAYNDLVKADKSGEVALEIFDNVATIQQLSVENHFLQKFENCMSKREGPLARKIRCQSIVHATTESIFYFFDFLATSVGVYFVYLGYYTPKLLFISEQLINNVGFRTFLMSESFKEMVSASSAAKLVFSLIDPSLQKRETSPATQFCKGAVRGDSLSFAYPSQPNRRVLNDVSFSVGKGRSLAFVGPSGGGKSTVVNLLERFYDPTSGQLYLDGTPFPTLNPVQLRSNIALVSQEPILFRGTIADNIRLGVEGVSDEAVREACRLANAEEFILRFPEGYSTLVGEKGCTLSGGQKQRIAIARAIIRNPKVIVLDEATSALDTQSEKVVREALDSSANGRTSVIIAHRLDTIRLCG
ncbi:hypothetical protein PMAYCL1PPCAC_32030, partial [Pristionchus mayeri]